MRRFLFLLVAFAWISGNAWAGQPDLSAPDHSALDPSVQEQPGLGESAPDPSVQQQPASDESVQDQALSDASELDQVPHIHPSSSWYLPRQVTLGGFAGRTFTPQVRISWEWTFIQERSDALMVVLSGGGGWAASTADQPDSDGNAPISWFFEQTVQAGLGYRGVFAEDWAWGFKVTAGPAWVGARSPGLADDRETIGLVEGLLEIGHYIGTVQVGVTGGLQTVMQHPARSYASHGAGGVMFGLFTNWR